MLTASMPKVGGRSPWGKIDHVTEIAEGVWFVSTPGHGGFKLSRKRQNEMPKTLKREKGWYEEDCEADLVVLGLQRFFKSENVDRAHKSVKNWFPDEYEAFTGTIIPIEESFIKKNRKFDEDNKNNYVVIAAWGDWHKNVPKGMVGCLATKGGVRGIEGKYYLVPSQDYHGSFVIDQNIHQEVQNFT